MHSIRLAVQALFLSAAVLLFSSNAIAGAKVHVTAINASQNYYFDSATNFHNLGQSYITGAANYYLAITPDGTRAYTTAITSNIISVDNLTHVPPSPVTDIALAGGSIPIGIDVNPAGTRVYAVLNGPDTVAVIDTSTNAILTSVTVGTNPYGVKVTPDGTQAWVTHQASGNVYVIATGTNTLVTGTFYPILSGSGASEIAFTPDSATAFVTNRNAGSITAIDVGTPDPGGFKVILVGTNPLGIAMRPDGDYAYVTNEGSHTVSVISVTDGSCATKGHTPPCVHSTLNVGLSPRDVEFTPDGAFAYVSNGGSSTVSAINAQTHTVITAVTITDFPAPELYGIAIAPPPDADGDGVPDDDDNCVNTSNPGQENYDMDALGDVCDPDDDNDGQTDDDEIACGSLPQDESSLSPDYDNDNTPDCIDEDDDNDGQTDDDEIACGSLPQDETSLSPDNDGDQSPDCVDPDDDNDGVNDDVPDNCPTDYNPLQSDSDGNNIGDVCDPGLMGGGEITVAGGGTVETGNGGVVLDFEPGDLSSDTEISVAGLDAPPNVNLNPAGGRKPASAAIEGGPPPVYDFGELLVAYDFSPQALVFASPVTLTMEITTTEINRPQAAALDIYYRSGGPYTAIAADCDDTEDPPGTHFVSCTAEIGQLLDFALIVPRDTDGDGVFDRFNGIEDNCPNDYNPDQSDIFDNGLGDVCDPGYIHHGGFEQPFVPDL